MSNTPEPAFVSIKKEPPYEIRSYQTLTVAEITLEGERKNTLQTGFRHSFKYIFGHNETQKRIPMTAPVIHFCAPNNNQQWVTRFIMPDNMPHKETPKPNFKPINIIHSLQQNTRLLSSVALVGFTAFRKKKSELEIFVTEIKYLTQKHLSLLITTLPGHYRGYVAMKLC